MGYGLNHARKLLINAVLRLKLFGDKLYGSVINIADRGYLQVYAQNLGISMNEFTRDELEEILYCVHFTHGDADGLADKIQSKIDNYCDHKNIVTGAYPRSNPPKKCEVCEVLYYE